jgi:uncharacterized membrane protein YcaP (DUF421 family)
MLHTLLRTVGIYLFLMLLFRIAGKRTMAETDTFDFVIILIVSEATQQALVGDDYSLSKCLIVITTLIGSGVLLALVKQRSARLARVLDGQPTVLIADGRLRHEPMNRLCIDEEDILEAAQLQHGLARLDQVDYAIVQRNGHIAIVAKPDAEGGG